MTTSIQKSEGQQWRAFLKPVAKGLAALLFAAALWFQYNTGKDNENASENLRAKIAVLGTRMDNTENRVGSLDKKLDKVIDLLSDVRVDVALMARSSDSRARAR